MSFLPLLCTMCQTSHICLWPVLTHIPVLFPCSLYSSVTHFLPPDWTASTRSMWRSAWLQASAPRSHSSSPSTTRWRWNRPLSLWRAEGEWSCPLLCLPQFPCSEYCSLSYSELPHTGYQNVQTKVLNPAITDFYGHLGGNNVNTTLT